MHIRFVLWDSESLWEVCQFVHAVEPNTHKIIPTNVVCWCCFSRSPINEKMLHWISFWHAESIHTKENLVNVSQSRWIDWIFFSFSCCVRAAEKKREIWRYIDLVHLTRINIDTSTSSRLADTCEIGLDDFSKSFVRNESSLLWGKSTHCYR